MQAWLAGLLAKITEKLLAWGVAWVITQVTTIVYKIKRGISQKEASQKLEQDISDKKNRTDEVKKDEKDFLNS